MPDGAVAQVCWSEAKRPKFGHDHPACPPLSPFNSPPPLTRAITTLRGSITLSRPGETRARRRFATPRHQSTVLDTIGRLFQQFLRRQILVLRAGELDERRFKDETSSLPSTPHQGLTQRFLEVAWARYTIAFVGVGDSDSTDSERPKMGKKSIKDSKCRY